MTIQTFTFNSFQTNLYVCHREGEAVLIDPSCETEAERQEVLDYLEDEKVTVKHLLLTHAHLDHVFGCRAFAELFGLSWRVHPEDVPLYHHAREQALMFGATIDALPPPGEPLREGDTILFGGVEWSVFHTPGHSPGSVVFVDEANGFVISGDVLFRGSIGRTDLYKGSLPQLMESIHQKLLVLDDSVEVYPGHGPSTTVGHERRTNPFLTHGFSAI